MLTTPLTWKTRMCLTQIPSVTVTGESGNPEWPVRDTLVKGRGHIKRRLMNMEGESLLTVEQECLSVCTSPNSIQWVGIRDRYWLLIPSCRGDEPTFRPVSGRGDPQGTPKGDSDPKLTWVCYQTAGVGSDLRGRPGIPWRNCLTNVDIGTESHTKSLLMRFWTRDEFD